MLDLLVVAPEGGAELDAGEAEFVAELVGGFGELFEFFAAAGREPVHHGPEKFVDDVKTCGGSGRVSGFRPSRRPCRRNRSWSGRQVGALNNSQNKVRSPRRQSL